MISSDPEGQDNEEDSRGSTHSNLTANVINEKPHTNVTENSVLYETAFIVTICMAQILALSGLGQALATLHVIGDSFGIKDNAQLSWYLASFSLTVGTFILPSGRLGDMYGHKKIFLIGVLWYGTWSLIAGFSVFKHGLQGSILFSVARGFQGIGPALMVPNALAIASRSFEGKKKNFVFACFGASAPGGATLGTVFGSIFSDLSFWPWSFWTLGIVCFAYAVTSFFILPADEDAIADGKEKSTFDFAGTITGVSGLVLFNFSWNQAAVVGWAVPYTYILLIVGILLFLSFIYIEINVSQRPLVPIKGLSKEAVYALTMIVCGWSSFGIWIYHLFQLIEQARHHSALSAAAQNSPVAITGLIASLVVGLLLHRIGVGFVMLAAMCCFLTGQILIATAPISQIYWAHTFVSVLITPWGMDMSFPCGTIILSNGMPREHQGIAASLVNTVVNYSISLSLGIAGTIIRQTNEGGRNLIVGYRNAWYFAIGLDGLGVLIALWFLWISLRGKSVN